MAKINKSRLISLVRTRFESMDHAGVKSGSIVLSRLNVEKRIEYEILVAMRHFASISPASKLKHLFVKGGIVTPYHTYDSGVAMYELPDDCHSNRSDGGIQMVEFNGEQFNAVFHRGIDSLKAIADNIYIDSDGYHVIDLEKGYLYAKKDIDVVFHYIKTPPDPTSIKELPIDDQYEKQLLELTVTALIQSFIDPAMPGTDQEAEQQSENRANA